MILLVLIILIFIYKKKKKDENNSFPIFETKIQPILYRLNKNKNNVQKYNYYLNQINKKFNELLVTFPKSYENDIYQYYDYISKKF